MKKRVSLLLTMIMCCSVFTGCSSSKSESSAKEAVKEVKSGGVVKEAISEAPSGVFVPTSFTFNDDANINSMIYEGLVTLDENLDVKPCLAESYEFSNENKTVTFKLRDDVKWHDGEQFTAEDVKFTFDFCSNEKYNGPYTMFVKNIKGYEDFKGGKTEDLEGVKKIDDHTVEITTENVYGSALINFGYMFKIIPEHIWNKADVETVQNDTDLIRNPIGTGSFKLGKFTPDQGVELVANDDYWQGRPNIDKYIFKIVSGETAESELLNKEVDIMGVGSDLEEDDEKVYAENGYSIQDVTNNAYHYVGMNLRKPQFSDKRVRQALAYALDRETIVNEVLHGKGEVACNPYPSNFWAHPEGLNEYKFDPKKSIELFKECGFEYKEDENKLYYDGSPFTFSYKYVGGNDDKTKYALILQQNFKDIGIDVDLKPMEFTTLSNDVKNGDFDTYSMGIGNFYDGDLGPSYHSTLTPPNGYNYTGFNNPKVDELIDKASKAVTKEERKPLLNEIALILNDELPVIYSYHWKSTMAVNNKIKDFRNVLPIYRQYANEWYIEE